MDPAYGNNAAPRGGITELGETDVTGILPTTTIWRPGETALPPDRPPKWLRRDEAHQPVSAKMLGCWPWN
jgi:hypothetical protein